MTFIIQVVIFFFVIVGGITFVRVLCRAYYMRGYQQGRVEEFNHHQVQIKNMLRDLLTAKAYPPRDENEPQYGITEAAEYLNTSASTLRRWEKRGVLIPERTPTGIRKYRKSALDEVMRGGLKRHELAG